MVAITIAVISRDTCAAAYAAFVIDLARFVGWGIVIAGRRIGAVIRVIADAVRIGVRHARATADTQGIVLVAITIAGISRDACTAAYAALVIDLARFVDQIIVIAGCHVSAVIILITDAICIYIVVHVEDSSGTIRFTRAQVASCRNDARAIVRKSFTIEIARSRIHAPGIGRRVRNSLREP